MAGRLKAYGIEENMVRLYVFCHGSYGYVDMYLDMGQDGLSIREKK